MTTNFYVPFKYTREKNKFYFIFFCELSHKAFVVSEITSDNFENALVQAKNQVRKQFNRCHNCGKWICDELYNEETMNCVECSPREKPVICSNCKTANESNKNYCKKCGSVLIKKSI